MLAREETEMTKPKPRRGDIHGWRVMAGYKSQKQLAKALGVSWETVAHWESGMTVPSLRNSVDLANALEVPLDWIVADLADRQKAYMERKAQRREAKAEAQKGGSE